MLTFYIRWLNNPGVFVWTCYASNNRQVFKHCYTIDGTKQAPKHLRNCVNHIRTIGKHLKTYSIHITAEANEQRKLLREPLYGCYATTER